VLVTLKEASEVLGVSAATLRARIRAGELVWATDTASGMEALQPVLNTHSRPASATVVISCNGGSVEATPEHPFWVVERGWVAAAELQPGHLLAGRAGAAFAVQTLGTNTASQTVFNLDVGEFHTYHVAVDGLLVHNGCGASLVRKLHGYEYHLDGHNRPTRVKADLTLYNAHKRDKKLQRDAGGKYRTAEDDGGHLVAHLFHGPADEVNLVAQRSSLNRGAGSPWRAMERQWEAALKAGQKVEVDMEIIYPLGGSTRPSMFRVKYWIDGDPVELEFLN